MGGSNDHGYDPQSANQDKAICLVSGGMDSCVTAAIAAEERSDLALLHVSYGQRTADRERKAFEDIANHYHVKQRFVVSLDHLAQIGGSSLTDANIPVSPANLHSQNIPSSYVPFRNAHLLAIATSWAETIGADYIYIGAVAEDSSGYPDCRPEFYEAFQTVIDCGTKPSTTIKIRTPVISMTKPQIILRGVELAAPLSLTWSCYSRSDSACGECDSCALRLRAFREAGLADPIPYVLDSKRFAY
ncbi:MAG TPA: 7-cyano-7-deazaguanine synthase QueC [Pyrinomonadaceae bacterium]|nr:7-cyano-7-deazaguanine synthase QueC [Pyrinomonadaceae bacterium]